MSSMRLKIARLLACAALAVASSAICDGGGDGSIMSTRSQRIHGRGGYATPDGDVQGRTKSAQEKKRVEVDRTAKGDAERFLMRTDYLHLYDAYMAGSIMNPRTGLPEKMRLGLFQKMMMDFSLLDLHGTPGMVFHSPLTSYLPEKDANGLFPETWLYWRTIEGEPEIQDGPDGPISSMFYNSFWQGVVVKICGDGRTKCLLAPRNHLKSSCGQVEKQFRIIRNPEDAHVIRTARQNLAKRFLAGISKHWKRNKKFRRYFGDMVPEKREGEWSTESIQLLIDVEHEGGNDPTVTTCGNATEATGEHWKTCTLDDVVAEKNSKTAEQLEATRDLYAAVNAQRGVHGLLEDRGTRWSDDDAHGLFIGKPGVNEWSGSMAQFSCFFMATALDGDETVKVEPLKNGLQLTQKGYGKPIWDGFPLEALRSTRALMPSDRFYYGQYFNQYFGTSEKLFDVTWIKHWDDDAELRKFAGDPVALAKALELNIFTTFDTARGKEIQTKTTDRTAGFVLGQTRDSRRKFVLDGFCEKLQKQYIAKGMCDLALKWKAIAGEYGGIFRVGFEKTAFTDWVGPMLDEEQRKRGIDATFPIEELEHQNRAKWARIQKLVQPYFDRRYWWPSRLMIKPVHPEHTEPYDLRAILYQEFRDYHPLATLDDLLDAAAYAEELSLRNEWKQEPVKERELRGHDVYSRADVVDEQTKGAAGGYDFRRMERAY